MQTRTIIDRIEIEPQTGHISLRMKKQIVEGDLVLASEYHRTMIAASDDPTAQMAVVNAHLSTMGYPGVKAEDVAVLDSVLPSLAEFRADKVAELEAKALQQQLAIS